MYVVDNDRGGKAEWSFPSARIVGLRWPPVGLPNVHLAVHKFDRLMLPTRGGVFAIRHH